MTRKKKDSQEIKDKAKEIASVVVVTSDEELPQKKASKKVSLVPEEPKVEEVVVPLARTAAIQNVKIKATASVSGVYGKMRYEIKAGETYTFPEPMAKWLISIGRAF